MDFRNGHYIFEGKLEQARSEHEIIRVKGRGAEEIAVWVTRHGPVIEQNGTAALALRWTAYEPGVFQYVFLDVDRARNWEDVYKRQSLTSGAGHEESFLPPGNRRRRNGRPSSGKKSMPPNCGSW